MENPALPPRFTNRLARETSPYLLQHAHNPVDWFPWSEEAFAKARAEQKPIFLSIGYSTCHWCHVMEHESFENEAIAAVLNREFISIKVDREERPDVDRVYMTFVQAVNGSGGWPMNVFLTPDLQPFSGGTYFPPRDSGRTPGFPRVLEHLAGLWKTEREKVITHGRETIEMLRSYTAGQPHEGPALDAGVLDIAFAQLVRSFDEEWGGFGDAPKFPRPATLHFLLRQHARTGSEQAREMALLTLDKMAAGGMHDHLGGGFHRYSVDREWHVPHFEKMLYDQAQLALAYLEAYQLTGAPRYERVLRDILEYVLRDLSDRDGGFHSAEDADSYPEHDSAHKIEGAFYAWEAGELERILGAETAARFGRYYGVEPGGNVEHDPHGEFRRKNVLIVRQPDDSIESALAEARAQLFKIRAKRPRPHLDDKVLTAWNALIISAFARAHQVLVEPRYLAAAQRAARFIETQMLRENDVILRSFRAGVAAPIPGYADDYAFFIQALLDLYGADFDPHWLALAARLQCAMDARFADEAGGYFSTSGEDPTVLLRVKEDYDGAEPAPSSVAALNLQRLAIMFDDAAWQTRAEETIRAFAAPLQRIPQALPQMLVALDFSLQPPAQIVIAGDPAADDTRALLAAAQRPFRPHQITLLADGEDSQKFLAERLPYLAGIGPVNGRAAAYRCENHTCQLPITDPAALSEIR